MLMRPGVSAGLLVLGLLVAACGGTGDDKATSSSGSTSASSGNTSSDSNNSTSSDGSAAKGSGGGSSGGSGSEGSGGSAGSTETGNTARDRMTDDHGAPGAVDSKGRQTVLLARVPGNKAGVCVAAGKEQDVRSGGFVGGPFDEATRSYGKVRPGMPRKQVRLYWVPLHARPMTSVTVTATSGGKKVRTTQHVIGDAEQWKFYDTLIRLPAGGTWRFQVSSGPDHGCFTASF